MGHALNLSRRVLKFAMRRNLLMRNVADVVQASRGPRPSGTA